MALVSELPTLLNVFAMVFLRVVMEATAPRPTRAATSAYSIRSWPESSFIRLLRICLAFAMIPSFLLISIVVRPASAMEALWAAEQALSSGVCAAVLLWLKGTDNRWLRRLKLAAEEGGALGVLFRPERHRFESSPAVLRLLLSQGEREPHLSLLKVQGGRPGPIEPEPCILEPSLFEQ